MKTVSYNNLENAETWLLKDTRSYLFKDKQSKKKQRRKILITVMFIKF